MNNQTILSLGFLLLCGSVFVKSLQSASAYPQGPHISNGSNPIANFSATCGSWDTLYTNNSSQPFIITDVIHSYAPSNVTLRIGTQTIYASREPTRFQSGLVIQPGETVTCAHAGWDVTISGHYTH